MYKVDWWESWFMRKLIDEKVDWWESWLMKKLIDEKVDWWESQLMVDERFDEAHTHPPTGRQS